MRLDEAKALILSTCDDPSDFRDAIEALPDRSLLDQLDPLVRALVAMRLFQLVTLEVVA